MKRKDINITKEDILASFDRNGIKYEFRSDHEGCRVITEDGGAYPLGTWMEHRAINEAFLRSELKETELTLLSIRAKLNRAVNKYDDLHRKNANRKRTLRQLNKAIKRKNERIAQLEAQLRLSKESEERANNMCVSRIFTAAEMFGKVIAFLPDNK